MAWIRNAFNKEPAMMLSASIACVAIAVPYVVVPIRRHLGLPTYQWDADPNTHPFLNHFGDNYKQHDFGNPELLSKWSQHKEYKASERLQPKSAEERDFPEARERLKAKGLL